MALEREAGLFSAPLATIPNLNCLHVVEKLEYLPPITAALFYTGKFPEGFRVKRRAVRGGPAAPPPPRLISRRTSSLCPAGNASSAPCVSACTRRSPNPSPGSTGPGSDGSYAGSQSAPAGLRRRRHELVGTPAPGPGPRRRSAPARGVSVMPFRTSSSMVLLLHSSSREPPTPYCSANARKCFWLGTTKPITYDSSLQGRKAVRWRHKYLRYKPGLCRGS